MKDDMQALIGQDPERFSMFMQLYQQGSKREVQLMSWPLSEIGIQHPELLGPYHESLLHDLFNEGAHVALRRNIIRLYQFIEIPEHIEGGLYNLCIQFILDPKTSIAVKAFSMTVAFRIAERHPALKDEVRVSIESQLEFASPGVMNRAQKLLAKL